MAENVLDRAKPYDLGQLNQRGSYAGNAGWQTGYDGFDQGTAVSAATTEYLPPSSATTALFASAGPFFQTRSSSSPVLSLAQWEQIFRQEGIWDLFSQPAAKAKEILQLLNSERSLSNSTLTDNEQRTLLKFIDLVGYGKPALRIVRCLALKQYCTYATAMFESQNIRDANLSRLTEQLNQFYQTDGSNETTLADLECRLIAVMKRADEYDLAMRIEKLYYSVNDFRGDELSKRWARARTGSATRFESRWLENLLGGAKNLDQLDNPQLGLTNEQRLKLESAYAQLGQQQLIEEEWDDCITRLFPVGNATATLQRGRSPTTRDLVMDAAYLMTLGAGRVAQLPRVAQLTFRTVQLGLSTATVAWAGYDAMTAWRRGDIVSGTLNTVFLAIGILGLRQSAPPVWKELREKFGKKPGPPAPALPAAPTPRQSRWIPDWFDDVRRGTAEPMMTLSPEAVPGCAQRFSLLTIRFRIANNELQINITDVVRLDRKPIEPEDLAVILTGLDDVVLNNMPPGINRIAVGGAFLGDGGGDRQINRLLRQYLGFDEGGVGTYVDNTFDVATTRSFIRPMVNIRNRPGFSHRPAGGYQCQTPSAIPGCERKVSVLELGIDETSNPNILRVSLWDLIPNLDVSPNDAVRWVVDRLKQLMKECGAKEFRIVVCDGTRVKGEENFKNIRLAFRSLPYRSAAVEIYRDPYTVWTIPVD